MGSYAIFNYQFAKIVEKTSEGELFPSSGKLLSADEAFQKRQELFDDVLEKDFWKKRVIKFRGKYDGEKEYIHRYLIPPTDHLYVMRVANRHTTTIVTEELKEKREPDYQNCVVIIDNRPGIQRVLIEAKKAAFQNVKQVASILEFTFTEVLGRYRLCLKLMRLQDPSDFWNIVNDKRRYPDGFYKIQFYLPYLNLERLRKVFDKVLVASREVFDSDMEWSYKAQRGGELHLDDKNPYQTELIDWMMGQVGSENIKLFANAQKRKAIIVGKDSFLSVTISDKTLRRLIEDSVSNDLFSSSSLNDIKTKTKTGIDLKVATE